MSIKAELKIEGELVDLAEVFKALAAASLSMPKPATDKHRDPISLGSDIKVFNTTLVKSKIDFEDSVADQSEDEPATQEQSEQVTAEGKKRTRRSAAQIAADKSAEEAKANAPQSVDEGLGTVGDFNALMDRLEAEQEAETTVPAQAELVHQGPAPEPSVLPNHAGPAPVPTPARDLNATVNPNDPFIVELRQKMQIHIADNIPATKKENNRAMIKALLDEFNAAGLSKLKEADKLAFKQRMDALPFEK